MREANATWLRPVQHRGDHAARLANESQIAGRWGDVGEAGIQADPGDHHTHTVGADDPQ